MGIMVEVNGNAGSEGVLIAPHGEHRFPVPVRIASDDEARQKVSLELMGRDTTIAKLSGSELVVDGDGAEARIEALAESAARGDLQLQVRCGDRLEAQIDLTSISRPVLGFGGRFQARFATDNDFYNEPRGTSRGWTFALEGEPDFCPPPPDSIADSIDKPVGRVVRFNNAVASREFVPPIGATVTTVTGMVNGQPVEFTAGDPVIGLEVNLGPDSYLASNSPANPNQPPPAEQHRPGAEPIALFQFHLGEVMSGKSATPSDRPTAITFQTLNDAELAQLGLPPLADFNAMRKRQLLDAYRALSIADRTGTETGRNYATRIAHLGGDAELGIGQLAGTLMAGYGGFEPYQGKVNASLRVDPAPGVLDYYKTLSSFDFFCRFFGFHSDELCGHLRGTLAPG